MAENAAKPPKGKNKRRTVKAFDSVHGQELEMDSNEEADFLKWLCEAFSKGVIKGFAYQPETFILSEPVSYSSAVTGKIKTLLREHAYSPDFYVLADCKKFPELAEAFKKGTETPDFYVKKFWIDVKGAFARNDGGRSFSINQKWLYEARLIYVYKLVPKDFFLKFGLPKECQLTAKTHVASKKYPKDRYKSIDEAFGLPRADSRDAGA